MKTLGLPLCRYSREARQALDMYDRAETDEEASGHLYSYLDEVTARDEDLSKEEVVGWALRMGRDLTQHEGTMFLWSIILSFGVHNGNLPPQMDIEGASRLSTGAGAPGPLNRPTSDDPWDRAYLSRHPDIDPDELVRQLWVIDETWGFLQAISSPSDQAEIMRWAQIVGTELGMDRHAVPTPWDR
jgi:hypothetical protein